MQAVTNLQQGFQEAQRAHQSGDFDRASRLLGELIQAKPDEPAFYHLSGVVLKKQGHVQQARAAFEKGIECKNDVAVLHAEYASLLDDLGEGEAAVAAYDRAIKLAPAMLDARIDRALVRHRRVDAMGGYRDLQKLSDSYPDNPRIWLNLALMARTLGFLDEAQEATDKTLSLAPSAFKALRVRAQIAVDRGLPAIELFRKAREVSPEDRDALRGEISALVAERQHDDAVALICDTLANDPVWYDGHQLLSQILWQRGDRDGFTESYRQALADAPRDVRLWSDYAVAIARGLGHDRALPIIAEGRSKAGDDPQFDNLEANSRDELGDHDKAAALYAKLGDVGHPNFQLPQIRNLIRRSKFETAADKGMALVERGFGPDAWPYISICWRMLADPRWGWLEGDRDLARVFDIGGLQAELPALAERLRSLHRWQVHPFEQSLRGGTQTENVLLSRDEPEIRSLERHLRETIRDYLDGLPPPDADHPVLSRPRGDFRFSGSWSVRLTDSGFHVNHIHTQGWISSALYVALPETLGRGDPAQDGWLALGEPPSEFGFDLPALKLVEPKPGRLALFPSIMWHGTRPFSSGERLTVAFDVVPR